MRKKVPIMLTLEVTALERAAILIALLEIAQYQEPAQRIWIQRLRSKIYRAKRVKKPK